jgi:predicted dehydrogenase
MVAKVRIAVAGAGLIGRRHVELIRGGAQCELAAIVDPVPTAGALAAAAGVPLYPSLADLFASDTPDGVIVATPNSLHLRHGLECIEAGVAVLMEKPIATTVDEGMRLVDAADKRCVPLLVGHHRRYNPLLAAARRLVAAGTLGRIVAVAGAAMFYKPDDYFEFAPWKRQLGGGPILMNMIHEVDDLRFLCGEITSVQAMSSNETRGFPVEDTVAIGMRFASGALGSFPLSDTAASARSWEQTSQENPSYPHSADEDCYLIAGTAGSLAVPTMRLKVFTGEPSWWHSFETSVVDVDRAEPLARQLDHFCQVIRREAAPLVPGRDAVETLRVTLAIAEAARTGAVISTSRNGSPTSMQVEPPAARCPA